jgi:hypothetical protein
MHFRDAIGDTLRSDCPMILFMLSFFRHVTKVSVVLAEMSPPSSSGQSCSVATSASRNGKVRHESALQFSLITAGRIVQRARGRSMMTNYGSNRSGCHPNATGRNDRVWGTYRLGSPVQVEPIALTSLLSAGLSMTPMPSSTGLSRSAPFLPAEGRFMLIDILNEAIAIAEEDVALHGGTEDSLVGDRQ